MKKLSKEDAALVEDIQAGGKRQNDAIKKLYLKYRPMVLKHISRNSGSRDDGHDLFQKLMEELIINIQKGRYKADASLKHYLMGMCSNMWNKELGKRKRHQALVQSPKADPGDDPQPDMEKMIEAVAKIVDSMTTTCKDFIRLYYYRSMSMAQVAVEMGLANANTAKNKGFRCIDGVRNWLKENPRFREHLRELRG